ncbi:MAG TPA: YifB family Mg chelatase-like AAA ATPase [Parcubacteria group bacterium]|jgi:magnesium chelatase family protein|nr:YifB family Mg chelatase-like AAA ATPase [Parcubacteria group bacterium]
MAVSKIYSAQATLLSAQIIDLEVDLSRGLHSFSIVGLGDKSVEEAKDRVSSAIKNSGWKSPKNKNQKVVVSLAPADIKKEGPIFDLPIAIAYLMAGEEIKAETEKKLFIGELSLDGKLRPVKGVLPIVQKAKKEGFKEIYLPIENCYEASNIEGVKIFGGESLLQIIKHINTKESEEEFLSKMEIPEYVRQENEKTQKEIEVDFADIKGQESAKRGLEIAAAGGHNIIMYGPPGTGKTMLAKAFSHLLPDLSFDEKLEVTGIYSIGGMLNDGIINQAPFRSPHHTASYVSLVGGGTNLKPGEVTLAHKGVLFMDEFPEFDKKVIESLRQPLEDRVVTVSRAKGSVRYPAHFILVATMNPCPCGNLGTKGKECICSAIAIEKYKRKLSGPIMDRIDMWVEVSKVEYEKLTEGRELHEGTEKIKPRVQKARLTQENRYNDIKIKTNAELSSKDLVKKISLGDEIKELLNESAKKLDLSARSYHRVIKLARTIADLEGASEITQNHILEALQYRPKKY